MTATSQPVLRVLPAPAPDDVARFRIEIRADFTGTTDAAFERAKELARSSGGEVTAVLNAHAT
jgi:hypothetical protein